MSRTPLVAGNWKLNKTVAEATELVEGIRAGTKDLEGVDLVVAPVATALHPVAAALKGAPIGLAAQNCYPEDTGAFTGELSPLLLADVGCTHCIVGHSERRQLFGGVHDVKDTNGYRSRIGFSLNSDRVLRRKSREGPGRKFRAGALPIYARD